MNPWILVALLTLIVPTQIFISYALRSTDVNQEGWRKTVVTNMVESIQSTYNDMQDTAKYYSTVKHVKELFMVPYVPAKKVTKQQFIADPRTGVRMGINHDNEQSAKRPANVKLKRQNINEKQYVRPPPPPKSQASPKSQEAVSNAREVEEYNNEHFYFARSPVPRKSRRGVQYRIGQVVQHTIKGYHGMIVGWDHECRAPDSWKTRYGYTDGDRKHLANTPHYLILGESSTKESQLHYIPQDHLLLTQDAQLNIETSDFSEYFDLIENTVDGFGIRQVKYQPKEWLMERYPEDD